MSEFRNAIADICAVQVPDGTNYLWPNTKVADHILAMPEMVVIREALADYQAVHPDPMIELPPAVRAWIEGAS